MCPVQTVRFLLASSSPRRRKLLRDAGLQFEVCEPPIPEPDEATPMCPAALAESLAYFKARSVAERNPGCLVLGADTVVALGSEILGKPADAAEAERMLRSLSGTRHAVITGLAVVAPDGRRRIASATSHVTMRPMTDEEVAAYVASGEWEGKAGAYAIQETADRFVERVEGSFDNVVGLPVELVRRLIDSIQGPS